MATFLLRPKNGGKDIPIPSGKTTIGRGPFLGVSDKRVSRSHAVLQRTDGKLTVLPLHTNPTFYKASEKDKFVTLNKDETKDLVNGNAISLLPDSLCFEVICEGSLSKNGLTEEQAEISKRKVSDDLPSVTYDQEKPSTSFKGPTESFLDEFLDDRPSLTTFPAAVAQDTRADVSINDSKESIEHPCNSSSSFMSKKETNSPSKPLVEAAPLLQKTRKLPSWLMQSTSETKSPVKKAAGNKKGKTPAASQVTEKKAVASNKGGKTNQTSTSAAQQKQKISDSDEDFMASDDEVEKRLQPKTKGKGTPKERTSTNIDNSDEDIMRSANKKTKRKRELESESDDENIPLRHETKQDVSKPVKPVSRYDSSGSADDEDVKSASKKSVEAKTPEKSKGKISKLPLCPYGNKCYRKNPAHLKEYSHNANDSNDDEGGDATAAAEDSDDDRLLCPYGTSCYRRNAQHKRDFKHTETAGRPKRKKTEHKSVLDNTSDDDGPNTYDRNDSFLDDDASDAKGSGSSYSGSEDSDWQPQGDDDDDDEDVNELLTEARGFLRSKNMTKPV